MSVVNGTFRGIVIDSYDPAGMNRIRVQVPQILGAATSGWAYPAWSIHDMSIWPEDRFPKPGDGVWIRFEGNDRMNWIGTFGIEEQRGDPANAFEASIEWSMPWLPDGEVQVDITGHLRSPSGTPNPEPKVELHRRILPSGDWSKVTGPVDVVIDPNNPVKEVDGSWVMPYARTIADETSVEYKVVFLGTGGFPAVDSDVQKTVRPSKTVRLNWTSGDPAWNATKTFSGTIVPGVAGAILPTPCQVDLQMRKSGQQVWSSLTTTQANTANGTWAVNWTRDVSTPFDLRAYFVGHDGWYSTPSTEVKSYGAVTSTPTITWDLPGKTILANVVQAVAGTISSEYGVPTPLSVQFQAYSGSWVTKSTITVNGAGQFSFSFTPDTTATQYRMYYPASGIWTAAYSSTASRTTTYATTTSITSFPATLYPGTAFTVSGSVTATGVTVTQGSVQLWYALSDGVWKQASAPQVAVTSSGTYTLSQPAPGIRGTCSWKVKYLGDGGSFLASESTVTARNVTLEGVSALTKGTVTTSSAKISWSTVSGATSYRVYKGAGTATPTYLATVSASPYEYTATGLSQNTDYSFLVESASTDSGSGAVIYGAKSPTVKMNTGNAAVTDSGTSAWVNFSCIENDAWRNDTETFENGGVMRQGYYSSAYGGEGYTGVAEYDGPTVKAGMIAALGGGTTGTNRLNNGTCYDAEISMSRGNTSGSGVGNVAVTISFYHSTSQAGSAKPPRSGTAVNVTGPLANSSAAYYNFGTAHGQALGDGTAHSVVIYRNTKTDYADFVAGTMRLKWTWNYTSVAAVAAKWY